MTRPNKMLDKEVERLIDDIARCYRLAQTCPDWKMAERLIEIGREFAQEAINLGADPKAIPE